MSVEMVVPTNCQEAGTPPGEVHERVTRIGEWLGNPKEWNEATKLLCFFFSVVYLSGLRSFVLIFFLWVRNCWITSFSNFRDVMGSDFQDFQAGDERSKFSLNMAGFQVFELKGCTMFVKC